MNAVDLIMSTVLQNFIQTLLRKFHFADQPQNPWSMSESNNKIKAKNMDAPPRPKCWCVYWEDLEEKPDMILEQDFHVDLWIENLGFTLHPKP